MKKLTLILALVSLASAPLYPETDKCQNCQKQDDRTAQVVIANFAQMVMSIIQMAANPHDPQALVNGGCNIVSGIANIAQEACKMVQQGNIAEDQVAELFYQKMIELGVHEHIAQQVSRSQLKQMLQ